MYIEHIDHWEDGTYTLSQEGVKWLRKHKGYFTVAPRHVINIRSHFGIWDLTLTPIGEGVYAAEYRTIHALAYAA